MKLYPYQALGARWLAGKPRGYLADTMGLGKTAQAISALGIIGTPPSRVLIVCPASAVENWKREILLWSGSTYHYHEDPTIRSFAWLTRHRPFKPGDFDVVIVDEAHYCKSASAQRTQYVLKLAAGAKHAWLLSGTPMPQNPIDLYAPLKRLWPEVLQRLGTPNKARFLDRFCHWAPSQYGPRIYGVKNGTQLRFEIQKIMLRRHISEVGIQLPPLRTDVFMLKPDRVFGEMLAESEFNDSTLEEIQAADSTSSLRRMLGAYKAPQVGRIIAEELESNAYPKIVVLGYHHDTLDLLAGELASFRPVGFTGKTPQKHRQAAIDLFQQNPRHRVFLAQHNAAGVAINLQASTEIALVEPSWSPEDNAQAIKRIHRIGQESPCRARLFAVPGTLDDYIMNVIARKVRMIDEIIN